MRELALELRSALTRRAQQAAPLQLFFRDDDVDVDEPSLHRLLALFVRQQAPISLGVIPGRLMPDAAALLNDHCQRHSSLFELTQHGWQHINHEPEGKRSEFGAHRLFAEQLADIAAGQSRMSEAFGAHWFPAFIPPWNRCTAVTARALDQLGFLVLSRDQGAPPFAETGLRELPVTLDLFRWRGGATLRSGEELTEELTQQIAAQDRIGVMLHHKVMNDDAFAFVELLLAETRHAPAVAFHTFQSLLRAR